MSETEFDRYARTAQMDEIPEIAVFSHRFHKDYFSEFLRSFGATTRGTYRVLMSVGPGRCLESFDRALSQTNARYVIVCDEDIQMLTDDWLSVLLNDLKENPKLAIVSCAQVKTDEEKFDVEMFGVKVEKPGVEVVKWCPCHLWLIDRAKIPDVWNDHNLMGIKGMHDVDYCLQVRAKGFEVGIDNRVIVYHPHKPFSDTYRHDLQNPTLSDELAIFPKQVAFMVKKWGKAYLECCPESWNDQVLPAIRQECTAIGVTCPW